MANLGITLLGLGPGSPELLTRQAWQVLENATEIHLRTRHHPTVDGFPEHLLVHSFDHLYEKTESFEDVYAQIVDEIIALGRKPEGVIYAVPGHPFVAESTAPEIYRRAKEEGISLSVVEGLSFLEPLFTSLGVDPLPHIAVVDALSLVDGHHPPFPPSAPALIAQIYDAHIASEVKLTLANLYPDDHPVRLVHGAGTQNELVEDLPLFEIDRSEQIGLLTSLFLPPLGPHTSFESLQEITAHLRAPEGCPWDQKQTPQSMRPHLMEEAYELLAAIDADDFSKMQEEFGDVLLVITMLMQIISEVDFNSADVIHDISAKLIYRHPHVFGDLQVDGEEAVLKNWEQLKAEERQANGETDKGLLDGVSIALPALTQAQEYQGRAGRVGFDWPEIQGVIDKVCEEVEEIRTAPDDEARSAEMGDLLFSVVNLARWLDIDAESVLREANDRFRGRFTRVETTARKRGLDMSEMSIEELEALWEQAKKRD
ncbi:MAG: nucleoside triphosphate pyrophosphohydrolase [Anaerolineales bacterium]|nr:nucleoside triphosphate pyrophosphohydrolase [Chloroflexota bacterium]MBL6982549.1 nucleoside triphosphate pyrophosphohydrolase [Anaerolineales bacterium]